MSLLLPLVLSTVLTTDKLGYECVPEDKLEIAFSLGGKGTRAPRTCIEDPCAETFMEETLANYTGYRDAAVYSDYRVRMTKVCGTPTRWQEKGISDPELMWAVFDGGSGKIPHDDPTHSPVPAPLLLLASSVATLLFLRRRKGRRQG